MKQTFQKLCHRWEGKLFQLDVFAPLCVETQCKHTGKTTEGALLNVLTDRKHPSDPRFTIGEAQVTASIIFELPSSCSAWRKCVFGIFSLHVAYICFVFPHTDLGVHFAEIETSLMMLSTMLKSPYSVEFRLPLEDWIQTLQELGKAATNFIFKN